MNAFGLRGMIPGSLKVDLTHYNYSKLLVVMHLDRYPQGLANGTATICCLDPTYSATQALQTLLRIY